MTPLHSRTAPLFWGGTVTFDYYAASLGAERDLIIAAITLVDATGAVHAYRRHWSLNRWSVPTRANFEQKFIGQPAYRTQFRVLEE